MAVSIARKYAPHALAVAIVIALGVVLPVAATLDNQGNECRRYYATAEKEAGEANCPALAEPAPPRNQVPDRNEWREEQDLLTQREMSEWARWTLVVSGVGVVISGLAVWLVRVNLDLQRRATKHALSAARAGWAAARITRGHSRAYVHAVGSRIIPASSNALVSALMANKGPEWKVTFKNIGQTVAKNVIVEYALSETGPQGVETFKTIDTYSALKDPKPVRISNIAPGQAPEIVVAKFPTEDDVTSVIRVLRGRVVYDDVYGTRYESAFIYWFPFPLLGRSVDALEFATRMPAFRKIGKAEPDEQT